VTLPSGAAQKAKPPLWRDRNFGTYWIAQSLSVAGDSFAYIAVPLLVLQATGSVARMGLLTAVAGAASVVAGVFGGVLVDRLDRRTLMIIADLARLVLYGLVPLAWLAGPQVWLLFVVLPLCEAIGMVFQIASVTAVRNLVDRDRITEANGRLQATYAAVGVAGPRCWPACCPPDSARPRPSPSTRPASRCPPPVSGWCGCGNRPAAPRRPDLRPASGRWRSSWPVRGFSGASRCCAR